VLGDPAARGRIMRDVLAGARQAEKKAGAGAPLTPGEQELLRYQAALAKMQRSTVRRPQ
jgi:hypothetical protein